MMRGKRENFFSREKKFSLSPRAPLTLSRKAKKLFYLLLPTFVGNRAFCLLFFCRIFLSQSVVCGESGRFYGVGIDELLPHSLGVLGVENQ